ncbi:hypothetical protein BX070DRAFT_254378 [Coemansia spiralis]|nr:hypothetical protein BX070DRAFT_254378 [Coemansia spiralis]
MIAGKASTGNKAKSRPSKGQQPPAVYSTSSLAYPEPNYTQYTHGSNVNAHLKPLTYNTVTNSPIIAQTSSTASSSAPLSRPHKTHSQSSHRQQSHVPASYSYKAFDHSATQQPLTSSVLAFNPTPSSSNIKKQKQPTSHQNRLPQPSALYLYNSPNSSSIISMPVPQKTAAWAHDMAVAGKLPPNTAAHHRQQKLQQQQHFYHTTSLPSMVNANSSHTAISQGAFENDMSMTGPSQTHNKYDVQKKSKIQNQPSSSAQLPLFSPSAQTAHYERYPFSAPPTHYHSHQQQQQHTYVSSQPPALYPSYPDCTAGHNTNNSLPAVATAYLQQQPSVAAQSQTFFSSTSYIQPTSHSVPGACSVPHVVHSEYPSSYPAPEYGSQAAISFGSESTIFGKPKKQVHFAK